MKNTAGKIFFVIGIIIILLVLAYIIITFVPRMFGSLAGVGSSGSFGNDEQLFVSVSDTSLSNGETFTLSWTPLTQDGDYTFSYDCVDDLIFTYTSHGANERIICNTPFTLGDSGNAQLDVMFDRADAFIDVPLKVTFTSEEDSKDTISNSVTVTIRSQGDVVTTPVDSNDSPVEYVDDPDTDDTNTDSNNDDTPEVSTPLPPVTSTKADLAISNVTYNALTNAMSFTVTNLGAQASGLWTFNYTTPANPNQAVTSPVQVSLARAQALRITVTFDARNTFTVPVTISVDPANLIAEGSESNNQAQISIPGTTQGSNPTQGSDITIQSIKTGYMVGSQFVESSVVNSSNAAIQFSVVNVGKSTTPAWKFKIESSQASDSITSSNQTPVVSGESRTITVNLNGMRTNTVHTLSVTVDSENDISETNEGNNTALIQVAVQG